MAGSQLKQLKAALKEKGLVGQTNVKKNKKKTKTPSESRRSDTQDVLDGIRLEFNQFDQRINRNKRDVSIIQGGKFVTAGSKQHNDAARTHLAVEKNMRLQYERERKQKGRAGGLLDKRFGENNQHLTAEEKMLERFTRERQSASSKKNAFALGSDDDGSDMEDGGFTLTHSGKALTISDDEDTTTHGESSANPRYVDEDQLEQGPPRKKTKKEVMQEVIAKSKFYKQKRQQEFRETQEEIMDLDEDFDDVLASMHQIPQPKKLGFSSKTPEEIEYDEKVRALVYDRRSVPADRTKTDEEIAAERKQKMDKLESDRLRRMEGLESGGEPEGDDLGDNFWAASDEEDAEQDQGDNSPNEGSIDLDEESESGGAALSARKPFGRTGEPRKPVVSMPANQAEFSSALEPLDVAHQSEYINKVITVYQPHLALGNKEKMNTFVSILFQHVLHLAETVPSSQESVEAIVPFIRKLSQTYNEVLVENVRAEMEFIQTRIVEGVDKVLKRDLVFFLLVGYLFSTSDQYHLIVTPALILMNEILAASMHQPTLSLRLIGQGVFVAENLLRYQRLAKRFDPEVASYLERVALLLLPEAHLIDNSTHTLLSTITVKKSSMALSKTNSGAGKAWIKPISLLDLFAVQDLDLTTKHAMLFKVLALINTAVSTWKDQACLLEIVNAYILVVKHAVKYYATIAPAETTQLVTLLVKIRENLVRDRVPLALQQHRKLAIATAVPKYEENFNPDKKSYNVNREVQEMGKMKAQLKKERKSALKDIRHETRFVARQQIDEKKTMYDAYHKKMAGIVNTIASTEGAEKNQYDREKKARKSMKK